MLLGVHKRINTNVKNSGKKTLKYHYWHFILIEKVKKKNKSQYYFNSTIYIVLFYQQYLLDANKTQLLSYDIFQPNCLVNSPPKERWFSGNRSYARNTYSFDQNERNK